MKSEEEGIWQSIEDKNAKRHKTMYVFKNLKAHGF